MAVDINIEKLRQNCFRASKVHGEFMIQLRAPGGFIDAKHLALVQEIAEKYGNGKFHFGLRQCFEIPGIKYENVEKVNKLIKDYINEVEIEACRVNMDSNGGFPEIGPRNVTACIGGVHCPKANINTQELAKKIEKEIYPSKYHIKVSVAGCPNDCAKAHFCDFGIIGITKPVYDAERCIGCGKCVKACAEHATRVLSGNNGRVEKDTCCCVGCGECILACPTGAWSRPNKAFYRMIVGGRTGKQYPRMGKTFVDFVTEDVVLDIIKNWQPFSEEILKGQPRYLHGGHLIDMAGYQKFKECMLKGVKLNPEARVADQIYWAETEYRGRIHVKPANS